MDHYNWGSQIPSNMQEAKFELLKDMDSQVALNDKVIDIFRGLSAFPSFFCNVLESFQGRGRTTQTGKGSSNPETAFNYDTTMGTFPTFDSGYKDFSNNGRNNRVDYSNQGQRNDVSYRTSSINESQTPSAFNQRVSYLG